MELNVRCPVCRDELLYWCRPGQHVVVCGGPPLKQHNLAYMISVPVADMGDYLLHLDATC